MHVQRVISNAIQAVEPNVTVSYSGGSQRVKSSSGKEYYTKIGTMSEEEHYTGEAESLKAMQIAAPGLTPRLIACGTISEEDAERPGDVGRPYFVCEYKSIGELTETSAKTLGKRLATELHECKSVRGFGFGVPTFCGRTRQENGWYPTWGECYDVLIKGLLDKLQSQGRYSNLCRFGEQVRVRVIPKLLGDLVVQPVLLHGDLWSGNVGTDRQTGEPIIFDPSSYYGHNEADLAIARIFGGFPRSFFTTYHENLPKTKPEEQYELRGDLYELYHYLNHTALFGGGYEDSAMGKMKILLDAFPE